MSTTTIVDGAGGGYKATVNSDGQLLTTGSATIVGDVGLSGLNEWQTSQYEVGTSVVQLTVTPLSSRSSMAIKAMAGNIGTIYVGNSNAVTVDTGYPLSVGDVLQLDLTPDGSVWAISDTAGQYLAVVEAGG